MKWAVCKLDSIKADQPNALVGGPFGSNLTTRDYVAEGIPVIRGANLPNDRCFLDDDFVFVTEEKADELLVRRFSEFSGAIFEQREVLAHQNHHLRAGRDVLLPRLMSGEIEV